MKTIYIVELDWPVDYGVDSKCYAFSTQQEAIDFAANFDFEDDELIIKSRSLEKEGDTYVYTYTFDPKTVYHMSCPECTFTISSYELGSGKPAHGAAYYE